MNKEKLKMLLPMEELEQEAQQQIYNALELPFLKTLAIMPDCHAGYTLPIGGVAVLEGVISPEYVGYDIGCGMSCIITDVNTHDLTKKDKEKIFNEILLQIPTGFTCHERSKTYKEFKSASCDKTLNKEVNDKILKQIGTLGGGNHFIELGENRLNKLCITIHSGSRKTGHSIAGFYMNRSKKIVIDGKTYSGFFPLNSDDGQMYLQDLLFAQEYALENRKMMMDSIMKILGLFINRYTLINENHNHAIVLPNGDVLHRKGATPADKGQLGVIPGNMRDGVYITEGLGNQDFLSSASHGAGRKYSRSGAKKNLSMDRFKAQMKDVICIVDENILDEAPDAYKDVVAVIDRQKGVVIDVIDFIKPLINIKASEEDRRAKKKKEKLERRKQQKEKDMLRNIE